MDAALVQLLHHHRHHIAAIADRVHIQLDRSLQAIALHEIGHVIGMAHSDDPHDVIHSLPRHFFPFGISSRQARRSLPRT